jgi:hypothetical protein
MLVLELTAIPLRSLVTDLQTILHQKERNPTYAMDFFTCVRPDIPLLKLENPRLMLKVMRVTSRWR